MPASPPVPAPEVSQAIFRKKPPIARTSITVLEQHRAPQRPGTEDTASTRTMGEVATEMRSTRASHIPAVRLGQIAAIHRFPTHAAHTRSIYHLLSLQLFSAAPPIMIFCHVVHICPPALCLPLTLAKSREARALGCLRRLDR